MTDILLESRRGLRQRAFQALMSLEYEGDLVEACRFAYSYDKDEEACKAAEADIPAFLLNLVSGVVQSKDDLDKKIAQHLKKGWTVDRLTLHEKNNLILSILDITYF